MLAHGFNTLKRHILPGAILVILILVVWKVTSFPTIQARANAALPPRAFLPLTLKTDIDLTIAEVKVIQGTSVSDRYTVYIAGRQALMRVFVETSTGKSISGVTARLCGDDAVSTSLGCLLPDNDSITAPSKENKLSRTLNFSLPTGWLRPGYSYHVDLDPQGLIHESNQTNNRYPATGMQPFNFVNAPALESVIVPIAYQPFNSPQVYSPQIDDLDYLTFLPIKILPIPAATYQTHAPYLYQPTEIVYNLDNLDGAGWAKLLDEITAIHNMEDPAGSKNYYGLVNSFDAHGCDSGCITGVGNLGGSGGYQTAVGWSGAGEASPEASGTMVHELGHNFNRKHVLCSGFETNPDFSFPYPGGKIGQFGLDVAAGLLYDPSRYSDFMSYCSPTWTSDYTYWKVYQFRQSAALRVETSRSAEEAFYISGFISPGGKVTLRPVYRQAVEMPGLAEGPYVLEMLGSEGEVVATHAFNPVEVADAPGYRLFGFFVPVIDGLNGLRLRVGERLMVERSIIERMDTAAFEIGALSLEGDQNRTSLRWPAVSHPSADIVYRLRFSADNGRTWQVLALDRSDPVFHLPSRSGIDFSWGLIEVQASDGIHTQTRIFSLVGIK